MVAVETTNDARPAEGKASRITTYQGRITYHDTRLRCKHEAKILGSQKAPHCEYGDSMTIDNTLYHKPLRVSACADRSPSPPRGTAGRVRARSGPGRHTAAQLYTLYRLPRVPTVL